MILSQDRGYAGDKRNVVQDAMDRVNERRKERNAQLATEAAARQAELVAAAKREQQVQDTAEEREFEFEKLLYKKQLDKMKTPEEKEMASVDLEAKRALIKQRLAKAQEALQTKEGVTEFGMSLPEQKVYNGYVDTILSSKTDKDNNLIYSDAERMHAMAEANRMDAPFYWVVDLDRELEVPGRVWGTNKEIVPEYKAIDLPYNPKLGRQLTAKEMQHIAKQKGMTVEDLLDHLEQEKRKRSFQ